MNTVQVCLGISDVWASLCLIICVKFEWHVCNVGIHVQGNYMSIPFTDMFGIGGWGHVRRGVCWPY